MAKVKVSSVSSREKYAIVGEFFEIISVLDSKKEIIDFLVGLLTSSETLMMARRIQIAKMLIGKESYETIREELGVSNQTITKTDNWLNGRSEDYRDWIAKCFKKAEKRIENSQKRKYSRSLLDRYPQHRILKKLLS